MKHKDRSFIGYDPQFADKYSKIENNGKYKPRYFKEREFACPCCGYAVVDNDLYRELDKLRELYGKPVLISSGYRCPKHNKKIGGNPNSYHTKGLAADIVIHGSIHRRKIVDIATKLGFNGIGVYGKHIHLDIGKRQHGEKVIWPGKSK